jgi:adenylyltransferase/sulfurtransferase
LKVLGSVGSSLAGRLLILDALSMQWRQVRIPRDPGCLVCGVAPATS